MWRDGLKCVLILFLLHFITFRVIWERGSERVKIEKCRKWLLIIFQWVFFFLCTSKKLRCYLFLLLWCCKLCNICCLPYEYSLSNDIISVCFLSSSEIIPTLVYESSFLDFLWSWWIYQCIIFYCAHGATPQLFYKSYRGITRILCGAITFLSTLVVEDLAPFTSM